MKFKLLRLSLLSVLALLFGVGAWAATVNDLKTISTDYVFIADEFTDNGTVGLTANALYDTGLIFTPTGNTVATNKGNSTISGVSHLNSLRVKNTQDQLCFKVAGPCTVKFYTQSHNSRGINVGSTAGGTEHGQQTASTKEWSCDITTAGVVYLSSFGGDFYFAGFEVTFPKTGQPTINTHPQNATFGQGDVATPLTVSATAASGGALSYQWYKNETCKSTLEAEGATAISGATESAYTPSTEEQGTAYIFCKVIEEGNSNVATSKIAIVTITAASGPYTNTWQFGKANGAEEFKLEKSPEYTYKVNGRPIIINTLVGKLNNASRDDQWAQCNNGTLFKLPAYEGGKITWKGYNSGSTDGFTIGDILYNTYYIATAEEAVEMTATGIAYLSNIAIAPVTMYEISGTITGAVIDGASIIFTAAGNGQAYSAKIVSSAFTLKVPADTYTMDLSDDVAYVVSEPSSVEVSAAGNIGDITVTAAQPQTVTGKIANAPGEVFILTFTGASHTKDVECAANATSFETSLEPDTYTIKSSVGELSTLSKVSFKILKEAANFNIYFPEAAVPAATQQNITVDNTATVAANVYNTVSDALAAAKAGNISSPIITLTSGQTYREQVKVDMANVTLKTSGKEKATITFYYGIGYTYYSLGEDGYYNKDRANTRNSILMKDPTRWGATVLVTSKGTNFKAENIIFENSFNQYYTTEEVVDGVRPNGLQSIKYDRTLAEGAEKYQAADTKAVTERAAAIAFENNPTGVQLYNCTFIGSQDTFYSSGKIYVKNSNLIGNTDYIFGGGLVVFDNCDLTIGGYSDKETTAYITAYKDGDKLDANKTYIFRDCTVKKGNRTYVLANLGRDWGGKAASVHYFNLKNELGDKLKFQWTDMGGGVTAGTANLHIYDFDPTINANYNTTGASGANVNGVLSDENALSLYAGVVAKLGFTPERIYEDVVELGESSAYNVCRIAANNTIKRNVKVSRTLNANEWNTIILPFALTAEQIAEAFGAESKVAELTTADNTTLNFTTVTAMEANTPYIINVSNNLVSATINDVTIVKDEATKTVGDWTETGSYTAATLPAASYFFNEGNVCKTTGGDTAITALNVYFTNSAADAVTFTVDGKATGINTIQTAVDNINGTIYNLSGQRVNKATRGLYIVNGKKVVIK